MNERLTGLERHEGENLMTSFSFWVNYPLTEMYEEIVETLVTFYNKVIFVNVKAK